MTVRVGAQQQRYRKRCKRWNTPNHAHYLTFTCFRGRPFLARERSRQWLVESVIAASKRYHFDVWAWFFMPEHVHLLIFPRLPEYRISTILKAIKQSVTYRAVAWIQKNAPGFIEHMRDEQPNGKSSLRFWQRGGGYDRNLVSTDEVREKIEYIHNNPVRRRLVTTSLEWEWSSARDHMGLDNGKVPLNLEFLPRR